MKRARVEKFIKEMSKNGIDQMIVSDPSTIFYLTGKFSPVGSRLFALLMDTQGSLVFFINTLNSEYTFLEEDAQVIWYSDKQDPIRIMSEKIRRGASVGVDKNWPAGFLLRLMALANAEYVQNSVVTEHVRMVKDSEEIDLMRKSQAVNEKVIGQMFDCVNSGLSEEKHHRMLHELYCSYGADGYNIIGVVAYGKSCGYAHHVPDSTTPSAGDCIMIDAGARLAGYRSDMTRTMFYGHVSDEMRSIYEIVKEAQITAMDSVKPGMRFCDIDKIGRDIIAKYGYGEYFTHRIGHNIGIDGHEFPDVGGANNMEVLPGMIFSVEPGIYIPGLGGVRIEDLVTVTGKGHECLNSMSKELRVI